jgi:hypothetical protein
MTPLSPETLATLQGLARLEAADALAVPQVQDEADRLTVGNSSIQPVAPRLDSPDALRSRLREAEDFVIQLQHALAPNWKRRTEQTILAIRDARAALAPLLPPPAPTWEPMELSDSVINALDDGIRYEVVLLNAHGFKTTDSGDGESKPADAIAIDTPHVHAMVRVEAMKAEADRMKSLLGADWTVEASYSTDDGRAVLTAIRPLPPATRQEGE